ncbi:MAG: hypothetical protein PHE67_04605 [Campylobacterales bacterium]|nr:hypothetical protein [Campylobacterales bacterium]
MSFLRDLKDDTARPERKVNLSTKEALSDGKISKGKIVKGQKKIYGLTKGIFFNFDELENIENAMLKNNQNFSEFVKSAIREKLSR